MSSAAPAPLFKPSHFCWICGKAVSLTDHKLDDHGHRVHDRCYALRVKPQAESAPQNVRVLLWLEPVKIQAEARERMQALCRKIQQEKDPRKFAALIFELQELGESENRLSA